MACSSTSSEAWKRVRPGAEQRATQRRPKNVRAALLRLGIGDDSWLCPSDPLPVLEQVSHVLDSRASPGKDRSAYRLRLRLMSASLAVHGRIRDRNLGDSLTAGCVVAALMQVRRRQDRPSIDRRGRNRTCGRSPSREGGLSPIARSGSPHARGREPHRAKRDQRPIRLRHHECRVDVAHVVCRASPQRKVSMPRPFPFQIVHDRQSCPLPDRTLLGAESTEAT
jgi:hypothetical protein